MKKVRAKWTVSILVLMEVALIQSYSSLVILTTSLGFNPCFNGSCSYTRGLFVTNLNVYHVSILVLMEVALILKNIKKYILMKLIVSILVLMEVALIHMCFCIFTNF